MTIIDLQGYDREHAQKLIDETYEYYQENPRSKVSGRFYYLSPHGSMCAIGRCLTEHALEYAHDKCEGMAFHRFLTNWDCDHPDESMFKEPYRDLPETLWEALQTFHDFDPNWEEPAEGHRRYRDLTRRYGDADYAKYYYNAK